MDINVVHLGKLRPDNGRKAQGPSQGTDAPCQKWAWPCRSCSGCRMSWKAVLGLQVQSHRRQWRGGREVLYQPRQVDKELSPGQRLSGAYSAPKGSRESEIRDEEGETERRAWEGQIRDNRRPGERDRSEMTSEPLSEPLTV